MKSSVTFLCKRYSSVAEEFHAHEKFGDTPRQEVILWG